MTVQLSSGQEKHVRVSECRLAVDAWQWPLEERHRAEIALNWQRRSAGAPRLFDGTVYLSRDHALAQGKLTGTLFKTDFKTMLYWRSLPFAASDAVREVYGSSLIRSAEGHLLYGRQAPGQLSSGHVYPPSGIIDADDVAGDSIDIDASVARELAEETGLVPADLRRVPGYLVVLTGLHVAVGVEWRSPLPAEELRRRILGFLRSEPHPELDDIVIITGDGDLPRADLPAHARIFAQAVFSG